MTKRIYTVLLLLFLFSFAKAQQETPIYQRAKIFFQGNNDLKKLTNLGIYSDHGLHKEGVFVISEFSKQELDYARQEAYLVEVIIPNATTDFLKRNKLAQSKTTRNTTCSQNNEIYPTPDNFNLGSMGGYLTYQEALDELDDMHAQFPNLISKPSNISNFLTEGEPNDSVSPSIGGNGIKWVRISDNPDIEENEPEILYTSIHHAREPMSLMQNIYYMWYLLENYETDPEIQAIVDNTALYFVPVINPDGYLFNEFTNPDGGGFWRKNRKGSDGVDNNRNYNYHINGNPANGSWGGPGSSAEPTSGLYRGTAPFSEVENQAMKWFVEQHEFVIALNSHSFGELLFFPFSYDDVATPDEALFNSMGAELTSRNGYSAFRDHPFSGDSDDFMYGTVGTHNPILSFTPEIGTAFWPISSDIDPICKEMMYQNITAAQMTNNFGQINTTLPLFTGTDLEIDIPFNVRRLGKNGSGNFTVSVQAVSDNIANTGGTVALNGLSLLTSESDSTSITLDPEIAVGEEVVFDLIINNGLYDLTERFTTIFGEPETSFADNGDSATANYQTNDWGTTTATFQSPSSSITDSPGGNYFNNENTSIQISEEIDLSEAVAATISFYTRFDIETNFDYVQLEISTNGGGSWEPQCTNLTSIGNDNQAEGEPLYHGILNDWTFEEVNLSEYLGQSITARFQLVTDNIESRDGFYFDDLQINVLNEEPLSVDDNIFSKAFTLYPNPIQDLLTIQTKETQYELIIHSILGQEIIQLSNQSGNKDIDLSNLKPGVYFATLQSLSNSSSFKIIKE